MGKQMTEMLKGTLEGVVLAILSAQPAYGYEITARLLKQPVTRPLLCVECLDVDMDGVPIKFGETVFCGDRVQLLVTGSPTP